MRQASCVSLTATSKSTWGFFIPLLPFFLLVCPTKTSSSSILTYIWKGQHTYSICTGHLSWLTSSLSLVAATARSCTKSAYISFIPSWHTSPRTLTFWVTVRKRDSAPFAMACKQCSKVQSLEWQFTASNDPWNVRPYYKYMSCSIMYLVHVVVQF